MIVQFMFLGWFLKIVLYIVLEFGLRYGVGTLKFVGVLPWRI